MGVFTSVTVRCQWARSVVGSDLFPTYDDVKDLGCEPFFRAKPSQKAKYCTRGCYLSHKRHMTDGRIVTNMYGQVVETVKAKRLTK